jgi:hypothetical protein
MNGFRRSAIDSAEFQRSRTHVVAEQIAAWQAVAPWRSVGVWMAGLLALSQLINAGRAAIDPGGFATYLGLPLAAPADAGLVHVYALRTLCLGLFAVILIVTREFVALKWFALAAVLMPLGDLVLTYRAGAPTSVVARHAAYVVYVLVVFVLLHRFTTRSA